jgi:predicted acyl esterase
MDQEYRSEIRQGMQIDWDVPIRMADGIILRADIFRPVGNNASPAILSYGPYGKWLNFEDGYKTAWSLMVTKHPDVPAGSSNRYQSWEVVDPEKWVPDGYACVRIDSRGCGRSPGWVDPWSAQEAKDFAECITWAAEQPWCTGRVGLNGISYYAMNQWQVAALQPKGLAAMCIWEGAADFYRDMIRHGGIYCTFLQNWYDMQVKSVQNGLGPKGHFSRMTGDWVSGPGMLTDEELGANRRDVYSDVVKHELHDEFYTSRSPDWSKVTVPFFSAGNWGGQGLHPRGNLEGFTRAASTQKWLEMHGIEHWTHFYTDYGVSLQKRFFARFLKDDIAAWPDEPAVRLQIRHPGERFVERSETAWPIPRTEFSRFYLHTPPQSLSPAPPTTTSTLTFAALGDGLTFVTAPLEKPTEITGPIAARLHISSSTDDADLFLVLRVFSPDFKEVVFQGALDPHTPIAQGWLRASHRKLDPTLSLPHRPYHTHDEIQRLEPGKIYALDIELWPTCIAIPAGHRFALSIRGRDYVYPGGSGGKLSNMKNEFTGCGPFLHDDPRDRPVSRFGGTTTLHFGPDQQNFLLLPIIP